MDNVSRSRLDDIRMLRINNVNNSALDHAVRSAPFCAEVRAEADPEIQVIVIRTASQVDAFMEQFEMAMGPNAAVNLGGRDVGYRVRREHEDQPMDPRFYRVANLLVEAARLGQKMACGAFHYAVGSLKPMRGPDVDASIVSELLRLGIERRAFADEEIRERCLFALNNEGAGLLSDGVASAAEIDAIWYNGFRFTRWRGGPMFYAALIGPALVLAGTTPFAERFGDPYWHHTLTRRDCGAGTAFHCLAACPTF